MSQTLTLRIPRRPNPARRAVHAAWDEMMREYYTGEDDWPEYWEAVAGKRGGA